MGAGNYNVNVNVNTPGREKLDQMRDTIMRTSQEASITNRAFQAWTSEMNRATAAGFSFSDAMNRTSAAMNKAGLDVTAFTSLLKDRMREQREALRQGGDDIDRYAQLASRIGGRLGGAISGVPGGGFIGSGIAQSLNPSLSTAAQYGIGAAGIGLISAYEISKIVSETTKYAQEQKNLAAEMGTTVDVTQRLGRISEVAGVNVNGLTSSFERLSKSVADGGESSRKTERALAELGLSTAEAFKRPEQQIQDVITALQKIHDPTERARLAMNLLGESGKQILPLVDIFNSVNQKITETGVIMDTKAIDSLARLHERAKLFGLEWTHIKEEIALAVAKLLEFHDKMKVGDVGPNVAPPLPGFMFPGGVSPDFPEQPLPYQGVGDQSANFLDSRRRIAKEIEQSGMTQVEKLKAELKDLQDEEKTSKEAYIAGRDLPDKFAESAGRIKAKEQEIKDAEEYQRQSDEFNKERLKRFTPPQALTLERDMPARFSRLVEEPRYQDFYKTVSGFADPYERAVEEERDPEKRLGPRILERLKLETEKDAEREEKARQKRADRLDEEAVSGRFKERKVDIEGQLRTVEQQNTLEEVVRQGQIDAQRFHLSPDAFARTKLSNEMQATLNRYTYKAEAAGEESNAALVAENETPLTDIRHRMDFQKQAEAKDLEVKMLLIESQVKQVELVNRFNESIDVAGEKLRTEIAGGIVDILKGAQSGQGGRGAALALRSFAVHEEGVIVKNVIDMALQGAGVGKPGSGPDPNSFWGKIFSGTVAGGVGQKVNVEVVDNTSATKDLTTATRDLTSAIKGKTLSTGGTVYGNTSTGIDSKFIGTGGYLGPIFQQPSFEDVPELPIIAPLPTLPDLTNLPEDRQAQIDAVAKNVIPKIIGSNRVYYDTPDNLKNTVTLPSGTPSQPSMSLNPDVLQDTHVVPPWVEKASDAIGKDLDSNTGTAEMPAIPQSKTDLAIGAAAALPVGKLTKAIRGRILFHVAPNEEAFQKILVEGVKPFSETKQPGLVDKYPGVDPSYDPSKVYLSTFPFAEPFIENLRGDQGVASGALEHTVLTKVEPSKIEKHPYFYDEFIHKGAIPPERIATPKPDDLEHFMDRLQNDPINENKPYFDNNWLMDKLIYEIFNDRFSSTQASEPKIGRQSKVPKYTSGFSDKVFEDMPILGRGISKEVPTPDNLTLLNKPPASELGSEVERQAQIDRVEKEVIPKIKGANKVYWDTPESLKHTENRLYETYSYAKSKVTPPDAVSRVTRTPIYDFQDPTKLSAGFTADSSRIFVDLNDSQNKGAVTHESIHSLLNQTGSLKKITGDESLQRFIPKIRTGLERMSPLYKDIPDSSVVSEAMAFGSQQTIPGLSSVEDRAFLVRASRDLDEKTQAKYLQLNRNLAKPSGIRDDSGTQLSDDDILRSQRIPTRADDNALRQAQIDQVRETVVPKIIGSNRTFWQTPQYLKPSPTADQSKVQQAIRLEAEKQEVDPAQVLGLAQSESNFNPTARSKTGAYGTFQFTEGTAKSEGINRMDPEENISGGVAYWKKKLEDSHGNVDAAIASYKGVSVGGATNNDVARTHAMMEQWGAKFGTNVDKFGVIIDRMGRIGTSAPTATGATGGIQIAGGGPGVGPDGLPIIPPGLSPSNFPINTPTLPASLDSKVMRASGNVLDVASAVAPAVATLESGSASVGTIISSVGGALNKIGGVLAGPAVAAKVGLPAIISGTAGISAAEGVGIGVGLAGAGAGVYKGVSDITRGGAKNVAGGTSEVLLGAAGVAAMFGPAGAPVALGLAAAGAIAGLVSSIMKDPRVVRQNEINQELALARFNAPVALNVTQSTAGTYGQVDFRGNFQSTRLNAMPSVTQPFTWEQTYGLFGGPPTFYDVPGRVNTPYSGNPPGTGQAPVSNAPAPPAAPPPTPGPTFNFFGPINAMDASTFHDFIVQNHTAVGAAFTKNMYSGDTPAHSAIRFITGTS